jgi:RNA polymerase sigma-70 factor, ECF subfamily
MRGGALPNSTSHSTSAGSIASSRRLPASLLRELVLQAVGERKTAKPTSSEELEVVRSMASKGSGGAEEIYGRYSERLFRFVYWRCGEQTEDAEELVLDTFLTAIDLSGTFDGRSSVYVWLCGIAKVRMIDLHRRKGRSKRASAGPVVSLHDVDESSSGPAADALQAAETMLNRISASQLMDAALDTLSKDECEALLLQHVDGLSVREIASHMKRSEDAIDSLSRRAKGKLKAALLSLMGEEAGND